MLIEPFKAKLPLVLDDVSIEKYEQGLEERLTPQVVHLQPGPQWQLLGPEHVQGPMIYRVWWMCGGCGVVMKALRLGIVPR